MAPEIVLKIVQKNSSENGSGNSFENLENSSKNSSENGSGNGFEN
ncbi:MAG: hypothetical protein WCB90_05380 [Methanosarcina sp.]